MLRGGYAGQYLGPMAVIAIAPNLYRIPTLGEYINSYLFLETDGSVSLVDCGLKRGSRIVLQALAELGKHPQDVQAIVLTHAHHDHAGGAAAIATAADLNGVQAHAADVPYLNQGVAAPSGSTTGRLLARLGNGRFTPIEVSRELADGDVLPIGGGLHVLHTPGHTPGHISLLHHDSYTLITGDSIFNMNSRISWPIAMFCTDSALNELTAARLADAEYSNAAFTHGPEITGTGREAIRAFIQRKARNR